MFAIELATVFSPMSGRAQSEAEATQLVSSFVDFLLTPPRQDQVFTCAEELISDPNLKAFDENVYEGIDRSDERAMSSDLVMTRSNTLAFFLTGQRFRLLREFASDCVRSISTEELTGGSPLNTLGKYSPLWESDYTIRAIYDAKSTLGFNFAQATPKINSVITDAAGKPLGAFNFHLLYGMEPEFAAVILGCLNQTNASRRQICDPTWEDFSALFRKIDIKGIQNAIRDGRVTADFTNEPSATGLLFKNPSYSIRVDFAPSQVIKVPRIQVLDDKGKVTREVTRTLKAGAWFAEWRNRATVPSDDGVREKNIYYYHVTNTSASAELEMFNTLFVQDVRQATHKDIKGNYTDYLDGAK